MAASLAFYQGWVKRALSLLRNFYEIQQGGPQCISKVTIAYLYPFALFHSYVVGLGVLDCGTGCLALPLLILGVKFYFRKKFCVWGLDPVVHRAYS